MHAAVLPQAQAAPASAPMKRPPLPADRSAALTRLIASYSDVLLPDELRALWEMWGRPALTALDGIHLNIIARCALDRAEVRHG